MPGAASLTLFDRDALMPSCKSKYRAIEATHSHLFFIFEDAFLRSFGFEETFLEYPRKQGAGDHDVIVIV